MREIPLPISGADLRKFDGAVAAPKPNTMIPLPSIETTKGELQFCEHAAGNGKVSLQLTQGFGARISADTPGFIDLSPSEAARVACRLVEWLQAHCRDKAQKLQASIREQETLKGTIFEEAYKCERFLSEFEVPKFSVQLLDKITV